MAEEAKKTPKKVDAKKTTKKEEKHENWVNHFVAWGSIALELIIIFVIAFLVCRP